MEFNHTYLWERPGCLPLFLRLKYREGDRLTLDALLIAPVYGCDEVFTEATTITELESWLAPQLTLFEPPDNAKGRSRREWVERCDRVNQIFDGALREAIAA